MTNRISPALALAATIAAGLLTLAAAPSAYGTNANYVTALRTCDPAAMAS
ncbi:MULTISPECIES: hypothetical protein [unclassified Streptomyces]|nr:MULTISPECIES: hypothetical protein [unclassified Streptomyces]